MISEHRKLDSAAALRVEHDEVRSRIALARKALEGNFDWDDAERALMALEAHMLRHFALESIDGYLSEAIARRPNDAATAEKLLAEHVTLRDRLADLRRIAHRRLDRDLLREALDTWIHILGVHERAENQLVHRIYVEDIEGTD